MSFFSVSVFSQEGDHHYRHRTLPKPEQKVLFFNVLHMFFEGFNDINNIFHSFVFFPDWRLPKNFTLRNNNFFFNFSEWGWCTSADDWEFSIFLINTFIIYHLYFTAKLKKLTSAPNKYKYLVFYLKMSCSDLTTGSL